MPANAKKRKRTLADVGMASGAGASSAKKAKKKKCKMTSTDAALEKGSRRTSFQTFHQRMEEMSVPRVHLGFQHTTFADAADNVDGIDVVDLATSNFGTALLKWRELNMSENFAKLSRKAMRAGCNLKQVVHNRDVIAADLEEASKVESEEDNQQESGHHLHLEPVLELWCALAKDLQQDFSPYFGRYVDVVVPAMSLKAPEVIRAGFVGLNETLKVLQRRGGDDQAAEMFSKVMSAAVGAKRMTPHAQALVAEAVANLVKRARDKERFFRELTSGIAEANADLCVEVALLSCQRNIVGGSSNGTDKRDEEAWALWTKALLESPIAALITKTVERMFTAYAAEKALKFSESLLKDLKEDSVRFQFAGRVLDLSLQKKSSSTPPFILDFLADNMSSDHEVSLDDLKAVLLPALEKASPSRKVVSIVEGFLDSERFDSAAKIKVLSGLNSDDPAVNACLRKFWEKQLKKDVGGINVVVEIADAVVAIAERGSFERCGIPMSVGLASCMIARIRSALKEEDADLDNWLPRALAGLAHLIKPKDKEQFVKVFDIVQKRGLASMKQSTLPLFRCLKKTMRANKDDLFEHISNELLEDFVEAVEKDRNDADLVETVTLLAEADKKTKLGLKAVSERLRAAFVRLLSSPNRDIRLSAIRTLRDITGEAVFDTMLEAESIEPTLQSDRSRMMVVGKVAANGDVDDRRVTLRFLFGNLFVNLSRLWGPTIELIDTVTSEMDASDVWEVVTDVYHSTADDAHARLQVLKTLKSLSCTNEKTCRFVIDDFLDSKDANKRKRDLVQGYARVFANLQNVRSSKRFPELKSVMAGVAGDFDYATQKEGLNFFSQAFKEVRQYRESLEGLLERERWKDRLREAPQKFKVDEMPEQAVEVLRAVLLGHLKRTVQDKSKRQKETRRQILERCSELGTDFLVSMVDHVVGETAPHLSGREKGQGENLGMALDVCILSCPLLKDDSATLKKINDYCVDLLCSVGQKLCTTKKEADSEQIRSKTRSRLLSVLLDAFKGFRGLQMDMDQMKRLVASCALPAIRRDDNDSSTAISPKLLSLLDLWLEKPEHRRLFTVAAGDDGESVLVLLNKILDAGEKVEAGFLAKLLDRVSRLFFQQEGVNAELMIPLAKHLLAWLTSNKPLRHKVAVPERLDLLRNVIPAVDAAFLRQLVGGLGEFPVFQLPEDQVSSWYTALSDSLGALKKAKADLPDKVFRLLGPGRIRELHFKIKAGRLLLAFTDLAADKDTVLDPLHLMTSYEKHNRQNFLYILHCSLGHIGSTDLGQLTPALDALLLLLNRVSERESAEEFNFLVQQFVLRHVQAGLRSHEDAAYCAFVSVLQFILKSGKFTGGLDDLKALTSVEEEEVDFLENMKHLQVHRRSRALKNLAERLANSTEEEEKKVLERSTLNKYVMPMVSRCLFNPTFRDKADDLVKSCIDMVAAICRASTLSEYLRTLTRYMDVEVPAGEKWFAKQKFRVVAAVLESFHFDPAQLTDAQKSSLKVAVGKLLRKIKSGGRGAATNEEVEASGEANLQVYVALAKITTTASDGTFQDLVQSVLIELCNKLRVRDEEFRERVRRSLREVMLALGPTYLYFLVSTLETSLSRGYELHVCVSAMSYLVCAFGDELDASAVAAVLPKVLHFVNVELFSDFAQDKKFLDGVKKAKKESQTSSYGLLHALSRAAGKESLRELVQPFLTAKTRHTRVDRVQNTKQALAAILAGFVENAGLGKSDLLLLSYGVLNAKLFEGVAAADPVDTAVSNEFALNLLLAVLKKYDKVNASEVKPFCQRVVSALSEKSVDLRLQATKILNLLLTHKDIAEHLRSESLSEAAFKAIHSSLRRLAVMKDSRLFASSTTVMEKMLRAKLVTPTKETAAALREFFLACMEKEPTLSPKILLSVIEHVADGDEAREVNERLCKFYVVGGTSAGGKARQGVALVLKHPKMKRHTLDFMEAYLRKYQEPQGLLRVMGFVQELVGDAREKLDPALLTKLFLSATLRFVNRESDEVRASAGKIIKELVRRQFEDGGSDFNVTETLQLWSKRGGKILFREMAAKLALLLSECDVAAAEWDKTEALCDGLLATLKDGVFGEDVDGEIADENLAVMRARVLAIVHNLLEKSEAPKKNLVALAKGLTSDFSNLVLHPNSQLREKVIGIVRLALSSKTKPLKKAWNTPEMREKVTEKLLEVLRKSSGGSDGEKLLPALVALTECGDAEAVAQMRKKLVKQLYEEKKTDPKCFGRRVVAFGWMAAVAESAPKSELEHFAREAIRNEATEAVTEDCEKIKQTARKILGLEEYARLSTSRKSKIGGGGKRKLIMGDEGGKKIRVDA